MKKLIIILLTVASFRLFAGNEDAVYLKMEKTFILHQDGTIEQRYSHDLKILSYYAIHRKYEETVINYNPHFQEIKIHEVSTRLENGKIVRLPANAINEVLPAEAADAPAYNFLRRLVITHTGIEPNCIIHVDYSLITKNGFFPCLMGNERIQQSSPVGELNIKVIVPEQTDLKYDLLNIQAQPEIVSEKGTRQYEWKFSQLKAISEELWQPAPQVFEPYLIFTTKDLKVVYNEFLNQPAMSFYLSEKARQWVEKTKSASKDNLDFIFKVHQYITDYIRTYPLPLNLTGYKIQTPDEVFQNCGGTRIEKLALMNAILQSVGIKPVLKLIAPGITKSISSLNIDAFSDCMIEIMLRGEESRDLTYYADQKDELSVNQNYGRVVYATYLPLYSGMSTYDPTSCSDCISIDFQNVNYVKMDEKGYIFSVTSPENKKLAVVQDTVFKIIRIPWSESGMEMWQLPAFVSKRETPVFLPAIRSDNRKIVMEYPSKLRFIGNNTHFFIENEAGSFFFDISKKGKKLIIQRKIQFNKQIIEPDSYQKLKELIAFWQSEKFNTLYFTGK
ncbi:MAG TPA: DUF3857 domain-containing protein [Bacteroidia bacterium]|nr:DUF3857 domain-containing protein [Bacteroidia bacterium]HRS59613.1 DUF3857 domain-containing protein [Bacteroidia bacterium]HRU68221.1 DUF3857 domain-containing protein [Bacteroidia bacterium]